MFRQQFKGIGKVSVIRRGQVKGHLCVTVTEPDKVRHAWYDPDGKLVRMAIERPLFTLSAEVAEPQEALTYQPEEG